MTTFLGPRATFLPFRTLGRAQFQQCPAQIHDCTFTMLSISQPDSEECYYSTFYIRCVSQCTMCYGRLKMSVPPICSSITPHLCFQIGIVHFICLITTRIAVQFDLRGTSWEHYVYFQAVLYLKTKRPPHYTVGVHCTCNRCIYLPQCEYTIRQKKTPD